MLDYKRKIGHHLLINIIFAIAIMIIIVGISVSNFAIKNAEKELKSRLDAEMDLAKYQIEDLFMDASSYTEQLSYNENIIQYLEEVNTHAEITTHPLYKDMVNVMKSMDSSKKEIFLVWIANEDANFYLDQNGYNSDETYDVNIRPWFDTAFITPGVNYTDPYIEWGTKEIVVSSIKAIKESSGSYGFVVVDFKLDTLPSVVDQIDVGVNGEVLILNKNEDIIYYTKKLDDFGTPLNDISPILSAWIKTHKNDKKLSKVEIDKDNYYIISRALNYADWTIVTLVQKKEVQEGLNEFLMILVGILIVVSIILSIIIFRIILNRLKPIAALTGYSMRIANGDLDESLPYEYTKLGDEMGELARSFVTITEVFKQKNLMLKDIVSSQYDEINQQYLYIIEKEKIASLGVLVAGVAHEINTPLGNGVTTGSYIHETIVKLNELHDNNKLTKSDFVKALKTLLEASDLLLRNLSRASDLVQQFKAISTNQNIEKLVTMNLQEEINRIIITLKPAMKHRNIEIHNHVADNIIMTSYPGAISQVINNFVMNSLHHGFDEEDVGHIDIEATVEGQLLRMVYKDDGKGIDPEILDHIFEPFYTTNRNKNNSGLGMYITHNLVNQSLSGTIQCKSHKHQGVEFLLTLPLHLNE